MKYVTEMLIESLLLEEICDDVSTVLEIIIHLPLRHAKSVIFTTIAEEEVKLQ